MVRFELFYDKRFDSKALDSLFEKIVREKRSDISGYYELPYLDKTLHECMAYMQEMADFLGLDSQNQVILNKNEISLQNLDSLCSFKIDSKDSSATPQNDNVYPRNDVEKCNNLDNQNNLENQNDVENLKELELKNDKGLCVESLRHVERERNIFGCKNSSQNLDSSTSSQNNSLRHVEALAETSRNLDSKDSSTASQNDGWSHVEHSETSTWNLDSKNHDMFSESKVMLSECETSLDSTKSQNQDADSKKTLESKKETKKTQNRQETYFTKKENTTLKSIIIIGIGGSSLGLKAIDTMLCHLPNRRDISLRFLEHTDPIEIQKALSGINCDESLFIIISKSGLTIETTSLMKYCIHTYNLLERKRHLLVISDEGSPLHRWADERGIYSISIKPNVGGRFSVLSAVGIVPLALLGYDVRAILQGAREIQDSFMQRQSEHLLQKALFLADNHERKTINVLFSYSSVFRDFNLWYVQLWGESLGKKSCGNKMGLTPISLIGSIDQHSFLQLILEGKEDKSVTMLGVDWSDFCGVSIPNLSMEGMESSDFVNGISFAKLLHSQQIATQNVIKNEGIPLDSIQMSALCESNVGSLIMYYQLLTSCVGCLFDIDTYNQPAVERGKRLLREMLR